MADDKIGKLVGYGQIALGVGFVLKGLADVSRKPAQAELGRLPAKAPALPRGQVIEKVTMKKVKSIDERVEEIKKLIQKGSLHPAVREATLGVLTKKCGDRWCNSEKGYKAEIEALFWALRDPKSPIAMRYVRDHAKVDQFHGADKLLELRTGDCDDGAA